MKAIEAVVSETALFYTTHDWSEKWVNAISNSFKYPYQKFS